MPASVERAESRSKATRAYSASDIISRPMYIVSMWLDVTMTIMPRVIRIASR